MLRSYRVSKGQRDYKGPGETYRERMREVVKTLLMPQEALLITCVDGLDGRDTSQYPEGPELLTQCFQVQSQVGKLLRTKLNHHCALDHSS